MNTYKKDLALNNQQDLIRHKTNQSIKQTNKGFRFLCIMAYQLSWVFFKLQEEQQWRYLTHNWKNLGVHTFPTSICPKVNVKARLEFELTYYDSADQKKERNKQTDVRTCTNTHSINTHTHSHTHTWYTHTFRLSHIHDVKSTHTEHIVSH